MEAEAEIRRIIERVGRGSGFDLEAVEAALRAAVLLSGARLIERLVGPLGQGRQPEAVSCSCGGRMSSRGVEEKTVMTLLGPVRFSRSRYACTVCGQVRYPGDELLDVVGTGRSPGLRRMMARAGSRQTFKEAREDLKVYAGLEVSAKDVERVAEATGEQIEGWESSQRPGILNRQQPPVSEQATAVMYIEMDGTGVPMVSGALAGRKGKQPDGSAKTREVKLGCVFTQTGTDEKGRPMRDAASTSFVGAIEPAEAFGARLEAEALRRGLDQARKVVLLADGALWVWNIAELRFPQAIQIIDIYHAREHVSELCGMLFAGDAKQLQKYRLQWWSDLDEGHVEKILYQARKRLPLQGQLRKSAEQQIGYFEDNKQRMRYAEFRKQGLFVGSGVVEAGCKHLIAARLKQSGMEWSLRGANAIIALRCNLASGRFEDFWEDRAA